MSEKTIKPDLDFVNQVIASGGESMKKCFQCATCTVVCNVTPESNPFPRKEMIQAQWGLKDEIIKNPDVWLCHHCSDCTAYCPRGAKPGEVLGAIRKMTIQEFSTPSFIAKLVNKPSGLLPLVAVPAVLFIVILGALGNLGSVPRGENGEIAYHLFMPVPAIDAIFILASLFAVVTFAMGITKYWKAMASGVSVDMGNKWQKKLSGGIIGSLSTAIGEILAHKRFKKCNVTAARSTSHLLVFYSFVGLAITTTWALVYLYGPEIMHLLGKEKLAWMLGDSPYPLTDPVKILGNVSAAALLLGIILVISNRFKNASKAGLGSYYDWLFIGLVATIVVTGIGSELFRLMDVGILAYPTYFIHLTAIFFLFAYAPFSKMAHMVYRTTAMVFERVSGRNK